MEAPERDQPGLHNVLLFSDGVISGSQPHGEAGFDSLEAMGIKTVVSVDGARPDLEAAGARGMRYVHVPIQYSGMEEKDKLAMAAALKDLPRPIYVHCHHGKHRGPSAAAVGLVQIGEIDNERADRLLHEAGLSVKYPGLWQCVGTAGVVDAAWLPDASVLPEYEEVTGMVAAMAVADRAWDNLELIREAGWKPPVDHPDLVPAAEAAMLREAFRGLDGHEDATGYAQDFQEWLRASVEGSRELESALVGDRLDDAQRWSVVLEDSCTACHRAYRNE